jgi:hypothetical protein
LVLRVSILLFLLKTLLLAILLLLVVEKGNGWRSGGSGELDDVPKEFFRFVMTRQIWIPHA